MSLAEACAWTLLRSLLVALCAIPFCFALRRQIAASRGPRRTLLWAFVLAPFFAPDLLVGYAYYNFALSLIHHPFLNELFYALLMFFKILPVGTVIAFFSPPPPISPPALHCRRMAVEPALSFPARERMLWGYYLRGPLRAALPAFALMFLLAFQEFDLVSLVNATSWTVWLFDQQAQGLPLTETLRYCLLPLGCAAVVLAAVLPAVFTSRATPGIRDETRGLTTKTSRGILALFLIAGTTIVCLVPCWYIIQGTLAGFAVLWRNPRLLGEIVTGLTMATAAAIPAYGLAYCGLLSLDSTRPHKIIAGWLRTLALLSVIPGLLGTLTLSLSGLYLFQLPRLIEWYDTPLPWLLASILYLLPRAMLLQALLAAARRREPIHLANLLSRSPSANQRKQARALNWHLRLRGHFWAIVLLGWWTYLEPTIPSLLRPSGLDPAAMRLYNFMHYGQATGLSAMLTVTLLAPLLLVICVLGCREAAFHWRDRFFTNS